jgi:hypothetical protein
MNDELIAADVDPDGAQHESPRGDRVALSEEVFSADELDDIVWDAFGSGLSAAFD